MKKVFFLLIAALTFLVSGDLYAQGRGNKKGHYKHYSHGQKRGHSKYIRSHRAQHGYRHDTRHVRLHRPPAPHHPRNPIPRRMRVR